MNRGAGWEPDWNRSCKVLHGGVTARDRGYKLEMQLRIEVIQVDERLVPCPRVICPQIHSSRGSFGKINTLIMTNMGVKP